MRQVLDPSRFQAQAQFPREDLALSVLTTVRAPAPDSFLWVVRNLGRRISIDRAVGFFVDGKQFGRASLPRIEPGRSESGTLALPRGLAPGRHELLGVIGPHPDSTDPNPANDSLRTFFDVPEPPVTMLPALAVSEFRHRRDGTGSQLTWIVSNAGQATSPAGSFRIRVSGRDAVDVPLPELAPRQRVRGRFPIRPDLEPGDYLAVGELVFDPQQAWAAPLPGPDTVTFTIPPAKKAPARTVRVPDLRDLSEEAARKRLADAELVPGVIRGDAAFFGLRPRVVGQDPEAGTLVAPGRAVSFTLAAALPNVLLPGVVLLTAGTGLVMLRRWQQRMQRPKPHDPPDGPRWGIRGRPAVPRARVLDPKPPVLRFGFRVKTGPLGYRHSPGSGGPAGKDEP